MTLYLKKCTSKFLSHRHLHGGIPTSTVWVKFRRDQVYTKGPPLIGLSCQTKKSDFGIDQECVWDLLYKGPEPFLSGTTDRWNLITEPLCETVGITLQGYIHPLLFVSAYNIAFSKIN